MGEKIVFEEEILWLETLTGTYISFSSWVSEICKLKVNQKFNMSLWWSSSSCVRHPLKRKWFIKWGYYFISKSNTCFRAQFKIYFLYSQTLPSLLRILPHARDSHEPNYHTSTCSSLIVTFFQSCSYSVSTTDSNGFIGEGKCSLWPFNLTLTQSFCFPKERTRGN